MLKQCTRCHEIKDESEFGPLKGYKNNKNPRCHKCSVELVLEWRSKNPERFKELRRKYYLKAKDLTIAFKPRNNKIIRAIKISKYYDKNQNKFLKYQTKYRRLHLKEYVDKQIRYQKKYPEKIQCSYKFIYAVKIGYLEKQPCEFCGKKKTQGHHDDYSKPYKVKWLCKSCHVMWHKICRRIDLLKKVCEDLNQSQTLAPSRPFDTR